MNSGLSTTESDRTSLLKLVKEGNRTSMDELMPIVYQELQRIARRQLAKERENHTLNTTALVHEAYLNLIKQESATWNDKAHFCALAARAMRRILIDYARSRNAEKRGSGEEKTILDDKVIAIHQSADDLLTIDAALENLRVNSNDLAQVVELKFYGGMAMKEIGEVMGVTERTAFRQWERAKAHLQVFIDKETGQSSSASF